MAENLLICTELDRTLIPNGPQPESPAARLGSTDHTGLIYSVDDPHGIELLDLLPVSASKYQAIELLREGLASLAMYAFSPATAVTTLRS